MALFLERLARRCRLFTNKVKLGIDDAGNRKPVTVKRGFRRIL
jgi:hypothetical protein